MAPLVRPLSSASRLADIPGSACAMARQRRSVTLRPSRSAAASWNRAARSVSRTNSSRRDPGVGLTDVGLVAHSADILATKRCVR